MTFQETFKVIDNPEGFDVVFDATNNLEMITNSDKVAQDITILLKTQTGEDIFHPQFGFNFRSVVDASQLDMVEEMITRALLQYRYVSSIESIIVESWNYESRSILVNIRVTIQNVESIQQIRLVV